MFRQQNLERGISEELLNYKNVVGSVVMKKINYKVELKKFER